MNLTMRETPLIFLIVLLMQCLAAADDLLLSHRQIGYTELRTNLPGGRHANVRTMRAVSGVSRQQAQAAHQSAPGTLHYHITPSADGRWLMYGSKRDGVRQLFVRDLTAERETQLTNLKPGHAAMWPHWRPVDGKRAAGGRR